MFKKIFKSPRRTVLLVVVAAAIVAAVVLAVTLTHRGAKTEENRQTVVSNGQSYYHKENLTTILFLGVDLRGEIANPTGLCGDNGQSDMLWLIVADYDANEMHIITIPRETLVDIDRYHSDGTYWETVREQICLQYAYGSDSVQGCELAEGAVHRLLGSDLPIDYYFALSMGAISNLVDAVDGVDVTMSDDYSILFDGTREPKDYKEGETVHMDGTEAYSFVHFRDTTNYGTNQIRMARQADFLDAFIPQMKSHFKRHPVQLIETLAGFDPYYTTDISDAEFLRVVLLAVRLGMDEWQQDKLPGTEGYIDPYDTYELDEEATEQLILDIFYEKAE